jgi:hypothetical protein
MAELKNLVNSLKNNLTMKIVFCTLFIVAFVAGTVQAQSVSDSPAPLPSPASTLAKVRAGQIRAVSESSADTLRVKTNQKKVTPASSNSQKSPSEAETPKGAVRKKD